MTTAQDFIIDAWHLKGEKPQPIAAPFNWQSHSWFHCQRDVPGLDTWLSEIGLDRGLINAVLAEDTRPRFQKISANDFLLIVRGVNLNPGEQPDDMLSLRILYYNRTLFTFRKFPFKGIAAVREQLQTGDGPQHLEAVLLAIIEQLHLRIEDVVQHSEEQLDELQDKLELSINAKQRRLMHLHRQLLRLHRFLKPQTAALSDFIGAKPGMLNDDSLNQHFLNQRDVVTRILEAIDSHIEQAWVLREHIQQILSERMNHNTYRLSLVAAIFMPLGFLTGLLGVNLGGIPGAESSWGFAGLCLAIVAIGFLEYSALRRLKYW